jgi:hypothetical protein
MSGGGSNETNTVSKFEPPDWTDPTWKQYLSQATNIANEWNQDPAVYQGPRVAPLVQEQIDAIGGMRGMALPMTNDPAYFQKRTDAANNQLIGTLNGEYMGGMGPRNAYSGNSPQFEEMLANQRKSAEQSFARGTAAQTDAAMARKGAYGGSAYNELTAANNKALNDSLNSQETAQRNEQYNRSAGMEESAIGRDWQDYQAERGRQMQALGLQQGAQQSDIGVLQALLGGGEMSRNLDQQQMQALRDMFNEYAQAPMIGNDILGGALTRASGGAGTTTAQTMGPAYSPMQGLLGGGLAAAGLFGGWK